MLQIKTWRCYHPKSPRDLPWWRGMTTLTNAVSGQSQNGPGNLEISPGIETLKFFFRETRDNSGTLRKKSGHRRKFFFMYSKNSGGWSKFPERLKLTPSIAQTAFVRVVTPRLIDKPSLHDDDSRAWRGDSLSCVHACTLVTITHYTFTDSPAWFSRGSKWLVCMSSADWRQWLKCITTRWKAGGSTYTASY